MAFLQGVAGIAGGADLDVGVQGGELFAQVGDIHPYHVLLHITVISPNSLQESLRGDELPGIAQQQLHHLVFFVGQAEAAMGGGSSKLV